MKKMNLLSKAEMRNVMGGLTDPSVGLCVAMCGTARSLTCTGTCTAEDDNGCSGTDENGTYNKYCYAT
jgi:hypothetical protein